MRFPVRVIGAGDPLFERLTVAAHRKLALQRHGDASAMPPTDTSDAVTDVQSATDDSAETVPVPADDLL